MQVSRLQSLCPSIHPSLKFCKDAVDKAVLSKLQECEVLQLLLQPSAVLNVPSELSPITPLSSQIF